MLGINPAPMPCCRWGDGWPPESTGLSAGSTATIVVGPEFYLPTDPGRANGLTVLTPIAPFEETTAANRRLAADVEAFTPGTVLTPAIATGYWSADLFVRACRAVGDFLDNAGPEDRTFALEALQIAIRAAPTEATIHGVVPMDSEVYCLVNDHPDACCPVINRPVAACRSES